MAINPLVTVGDYALPDPSTYTGQTSTMVSDGRNAKGYYIGSVIRADTAKVELGWNYLTAQQWANILNCFSGAANFVRPVTFYNQSTNSYQTRKMYVSDRTSGMWRRDPKTGAVLGWTDCKLSLVEV